MATLIKVDGTTSQVKPKNGKSFSLDELQGFVGGYIEFVRMSYGDGPVDLLCLNEEGKLNELEYNPAATLLVGHMLMPGDYIAGDAVLMTPAEAGEEC